MNRVGRPRASSRDTLAEAACELFLEQGYDATSVADITTRAGVSRSSFFNYFSSKADVLWWGLDERLDAATTALRSGLPVRDALAAIGEDFAPDHLALAITHEAAMGLAGELDRERAARQLRLGRAVAERLDRDGSGGLMSEVTGSAYAGAVFAAVWAWAQGGPGGAALVPLLHTALSAVPAPGPVRQLRLVVRADRFDEALEFYRDVLGMPQAGAYEAEGGARVAILDAGRATLELANPAQADYIDAVETDGDAPSDPLRVAFEVADADAAASMLTAAGAELLASARVTPWRSVNARLRAPAGLQVTLFQEPTG
ncbi:TetR family transcriptional regulator [Microbacterium sp. zg-Y818]|uniref:TetR family transcriptional regulator n=1 Tax=unclassified Microbacterium TaxID=2609290 RepID=UPI00214C75F9|nr:MULTISPECIES: TetR family transcriptional regulator [unclassified Microbacterium]MCR2801083.1 TetR family transcriptional regulator [Microbacterium sp. zg.Y818]WIM23786.1 TetR family transcriptional regulator [Microbacterium sp. zg-Y818]